MTNVIRSADVADKAISVRLDADTQRALKFLMREGVSQSDAIRSALISAARADRYAQMEADAKRIANDPVDRAVIADIQEFFGEL